MSDITRNSIVLSARYKHLIRKRIISLLFVQPGIRVTLLCGAGYHLLRLARDQLRRAPAATDGNYPTARRDFNFFKSLSFVRFYCQSRSRDHADHVTIKSRDL